MADAMARTLADEDADGDVDGGLDRGALVTFTARHTTGALGGLGSVGLDIRPLRGGLQAATVAHVRVRRAGAARPADSTEFVVKHVRSDGATREAAVYEALAGLDGPPLTPRLLHVQRRGGGCDLYLEYVRPWRRWPWGDTTLAGRTLEELARLHAALATVGHAPGADWDYEVELRESAATTLEALETVTAKGEWASFRPAVPEMRRVVAALPAVRRRLLEAPSPGLEPGPIHGDVHPGNVVVARRGGCLRLVLLDWGRVRRGSPLEDVSSWLQSLGLWEPEAARRHDTLLRRYLYARALPDRLDRDLRDGYWFAGACNALAGTLRYHLAVADGWRSPGPRARADAARAARAYLRVVHRADACWRR